MVYLRFTISYIRDVWCQMTSHFGLRVFWFAWGSWWCCMVCFYLHIGTFLATQLQFRDNSPFCNERLLVKGVSPALRACVLAWEVKNVRLASVFLWGVPPPSRPDQLLMDRDSASLSKYLREVIDLPVPGFPPWWNREGALTNGPKGPFQSLKHLVEISYISKWNVTVWWLLSKIPYKFKKSEWTELTVILVHVRISGWT